MSDTTLDEKYEQVKRDRKRLAAIQRQIDRLDGQRIRLVNEMAAIKMRYSESEEKA